MKTPPLPAVIVDTREQKPFTFNRLFTLAGQPVSSSKGTLRSGDYSLSGCTDLVAVERKSLADLYSTLSHGRARFVREMERLSAMRFAVIVIESSLAEIITNPPTAMNPKSVIATILAWSIRYPVRWLTCDNRRLAEVMTLRTLERYWIETHKPTTSAVKGHSHEFGILARSDLDRSDRRRGARIRSRIVPHRTR